MIAYHITYTLPAMPMSPMLYAQVDAKDMKSALKKLAKKHGYKTTKLIVLNDVSVVGYY